MYWMIALVVLLICAGTVVVLRRRPAAPVQSEPFGEMERELRIMRSMDAKRRRTINTLRTQLYDAELESEALAARLDTMQAQLTEAQQRIESAEHRRIQAEREASAEHMKADILEKKLMKVKDEQINQEKLYQDIIAEKDRQLARAQEQQRRRAAKRTEALSDQISFHELFNSKEG